MPRTRLHSAITLVVLLLSAAAQAARPPVAEALPERTQPFSATEVLPFFAADGTPGWQAVPALCAPEGCAADAPPEALLVTPPVVLWRCRNGRVLAGANWQRPLVHVSGTFRIDLYVGSVRTDAITLDTLEVIDPASGETRQTAPMDSIDTPPRPMPKIRNSGPVVCPSDGGTCYGALSEGAQSGLRRIEREGRITVLEQPQRKWFAPIVVADLQIGPGGKTLLLAEEWHFRGPKWVRFAIIDAATGQRQFEQRHGEGRMVSNARVVLGPGGQVVFSYRDDSAGRHVLVPYRLHAPAVGR